MKSLAYVFTVISVLLTATNASVALSLGDQERSSTTLMALSSQEMVLLQKLRADETMPKNLWQKTSHYAREYKKPLMIAAGFTVLMGGSYYLGHQAGHKDNLNPAIVYDHNGIAYFKAGRLSEVLFKVTAYKTIQMAGDKADEKANTIAMAGGGLVGWGSYRIFSRCTSLGQGAKVLAKEIGADLVEGMLKKGSDFLGATKALNDSAVRHAQKRMDRTEVKDVVKIAKNFFDISGDVEKLENDVRRDVSKVAGWVWGCLSYPWR